MEQKYSGANGVPFTDVDLEQWGDEAEAGFTDWKFGKPIAGRPVSVGEDARPFTIRLDSARRAKLDRAAQAEHTTVSQLMRNLIDAL